MTLLFSWAASCTTATLQWARDFHHYPSVLLRAEPISTGKILNMALDLSIINEHFNELIPLVIFRVSFILNSWLISLSLFLFSLFHSTCMKNLGLGFTRQQERHTCWFLPLFSSEARKSNASLIYILLNPTDINLLKSGYMICSIRSVQYAKHDGLAVVKFITYF